MVASLPLLAEFVLRFCRRPFLNVADTLSCCQRTTRFGTRTQVSPTRIHGCRASVNRERTMRTCIYYILPYVLPQRFRVDNYDEFHIASFKLQEKVHQFSSK